MLPEKMKRVGQGMVTGMLGLVGATLTGLLAILAPFANATEVPITDCDILAAHPDDEQRADVAGVLFEEIDISRALAECSQAAADYPETPRLLFQLGRVLDAQGDVDAAIDQLTKAAEAHHIQAAFGLLLIYLEKYDASGGEDIGAYDELLRWLTHLADTSDTAFAQYALGANYLYHAPEERLDIELGKQYLLKSAENGYLEAQYLVGIMYRDGDYFSQDFEQAGEWLLRAAVQDYPVAQFELAEFVLSGQSSVVSDDRALEMLDSAVQAGVLEAEGFLGELLVTGTSVVQNIPRGFELLENAALQGEVRAQEFLWGIYLPYYIPLMFSDEDLLTPEDMPANMGPFFDRTSDDAIRWAEMMSDNDHPDGLILLAPLYEVGAGVEQDIEKAFELYSRAAALGHPLAIERVERLLEDFPELLADQ